MTDPQQALTACRQVGLTEGQWITDARAGRGQIETLTPTLVVVVTEDGEPIALDGASVLYESYQDGGIEVTEGP